MATIIVHDGASVRALITCGVRCMSMIDIRKSLCLRTRDLAGDSIWQSLSKGRPPGWSDRLLNAECEQFDRVFHIGCLLQVDSDLVSAATVGSVVDGNAISVVEGFA